MKSTKITNGTASDASQLNNVIDDARGGSFLLVHAQSSPNMTLKVESGACYVGASRVIYAGGNTPSFTAPSTNPRIDLVTIDSSGTIAITQGTEAASPAVPAYPNNKLVLVEVYHRIGESALYDADQGTGGYVSNDVRPFLGGAYIANDAQVDAAAAINFSKLNYGNVGVVITPDADTTRDLGSISKRFASLYAQYFRGDGSNLTGLSTAQMTKTLVAAESISQDNAVAATLYQTSNIALDTKLIGTDNSATNTISVTVGNNSNRILVLIVNSWSGGGQPASWNTPTFNGASFTVVQNNSTYASGNYYGQLIAYLVAPSVGTYNLVWSNSSGYTSGCYAIYSLYNAKQTQAGNFVTSVSGGATSSSLTLTTNADGSAAIGVISTGNTNVGTPAGNVYAADTQVNGTHGYSGDSGLSNQYGAGSAMTLSTSGATGGSNISISILQVDPYSTPSPAVQKASSAANNTRCSGFIGFAQNSASAGQNVVVTTGGIHTFASGAKASGVGHYLNDTQGALGTIAGTVSRKIGIGISALQLLITNIW